LRAKCPEKFFNFLQPSAFSLLGMRYAFATYRPALNGGMGNIDNADAANI